VGIAIGLFFTLGQVNNINAETDAYNAIVVKVDREVEPG
jgi:hypothetical protein